LKSRNSTLAGQSGGHLRHTIRGPNFHHQRGHYRKLTPNEANVEALRRAFEVAGVQFVTAIGGGSGVRLR
jgi:alcohol dehydrogenase class IV